MFYDQFVKLCEEKGIKPSPVLKQLGLSSGNLKKWQTGSTVSSDTLEKLSAYFGVPIDYFFQGEDNYVEANISNDANAITNVYYIMKAHPDLMCSILKGEELDAASLARIAKYMGCSVTYLNPELDGQKLLEPEQSKPLPLTENEQILDILGRAAANKPYRCLQVQISRIVISNLERFGKTPDDLYAIKLSEKKISDLFDRSKKPTEIAPLNTSDIFRIVREFDVGLTFLFTGREVT